MSKSKKKRNKKYSGRDAAVTQPKVTRVSVPDRSPSAKWWHENRKKVTSRMTIFAVALIIFGLFSWLWGVIF